MKPSKLNYELTEQQYSEMYQHAQVLAYSFCIMNEIVYLDIEDRDKDNNSHVSFRVRLKQNRFVDSDGSFNVTEDFIEYVEKCIEPKYWIQWNNSRSIFSIWLKG